MRHWRSGWPAVACLVGILLACRSEGQESAAALSDRIADRRTPDGHLLRSNISEVPGGNEDLPAGGPPSGIPLHSGYWTALQSGMNATVNAVAVSDTNTFAGGFFTDAGGITANYIARWDGSAWHPLGSGVNGYNPAVYAITASGNDVYAGGVFVTAGGQASQGIARWDGSSWHSLGGGVDGSVYAILVDGSNVYAGGFFSTAGGVPARNIARWDGSSWHSLGAGVDNVVRSLAIYDGQLVAGGEFDSSGTMPLPFLGSWNGSSWEAFGGGMDFYVYTLVPHGDTLYAGGVFTMAGGVSASYVARWDGATWAPLGTGVNSIVYSLAVTPVGLFAGGLFTQAGDQYANQTARWDGTAWSTQSGGVNNVVFAAAARGSDVFFGGAFTIAGAQPASRIAMWREVNSSILAMAQGWNLVSLPRTPTTFSPDNLFPGRSGAMFAYNNATQNYESAGVLAVGPGYWVKYDVATAISISGTDLDTVSVTAVQPGWVLLGSVTNPFPVSSLVTVPSGLIEGLVFRYNRTTQTYEPTTEIAVGEGHWVKVTAPCTLQIR